MPTERVSPRLAVVVVPVSADEFAGTGLATALPPDRLKALLAAAILDVFGALARVDGATIAVIVRGPEEAAALLPELPAGIEIVADEPAAGRPPRARADRLLAAASSALLVQRFERVVGIAGDVLRLTPRVVATALSTLAGADLAIGSSTGGAGYLVGCREAGRIDGVGPFVGLSPSGTIGLVTSAEERRLVVRRVESLPRLSELASLADVARAVASDPAASPRVGRWLAERGGDDVRPGEGARRASSDISH